MNALEEVDRLAPLPEAIGDEPADPFSQRLRELTNAALLGTADANGFEAVVEEGRREVERLRSSLANHLANDRVAFQIRARLSGSGGTGRALHVDGYDTHATADPSSVPRFQTVLDERGQAELEAARELEQVVRAARDGTLEADLRAARDAIREQLETLRTALRSGALEDALKDVLASLEEEEQPALVALRRDVRATLVFLERWRSLEVPSADDPAGTLSLLASTLTAFLDEATGTLGSLRSSLQELPQALEELGTTVGNQAAEAAQTVVAALAADARIQAVQASWSRLRGSFQRRRALEESVLALGELARELDGSDFLDTHIDLLTAGPRSAGDDLRIELEVFHPASESRPRRVVARNRVVLRVGFVGLHSVVRGGLLFVDGRGSVSGDADWEPVPSIGYFLHYRDDDFGAFWNEVLDPGLGFTLSVLDFDDENDLEVGVAAGLTLFQDVLWVGYGRNLQADADYAYVGINPLALGGLWQRSD